MPKQCWIALAIFFIVLRALFRLLVKWARQPARSESERLEAASEKLAQAVEVMPSATNYLLHSRAGDAGYVIHIALPDHYAHPDNITQKNLKCLRNFC